MPPQSIVVEQERKNAIKARLEAIDKLELKYKEQKNTIHTLWGFCDTPLRWPIVTWHAIYHVIAFYTLFNLTKIKLWTYVFGFFVGTASNFGANAGAHRLWGHRSFKANVPLRIIIAFCYAVSGQYSSFRWARDHRLHHKYTDTNADPYSTGRGFFFAHLGWLLLKKHPAFLRAATGIDSSDLQQDGVLMWFHRNFILTVIGIWGVFGVGVPVVFWGESLYWSFCANVLRTVVAGQVLAAINSVAHSLGTRPYDKNSTARENPLYAFLIMGEGYHNFHHAFPLDYRGSEHPNYFTNTTGFFIDLFGLIGWAYDFKRVSPEVIRRVAINKGDGTHPVYKKHLDGDTEGSMLGYAPNAY